MLLVDFNSDDSFIYYLLLFIFYFMIIFSKLSYYIKLEHPDQINIKGHSVPTMHTHTHTFMFCYPL